MNDDQNIVAAPEEEVAAEPTVTEEAPASEETAA